jgi:hypothetical protein
MKGSVFKRCTTCGRVVRQRACEHPACSAGGYSWAFYVRLGRRGDGKSRQMQRSGFSSKRLAEQALAAAIAEHRAGFDPPSQLTVADFLLERWLPRTRTAPKTRQDRETHMRAYVVPRIGGRRLLELTGDDLTEMYDDLAVRGRTRRPHPELGWGLSPSTVRRIHTQLHKAFADAIRWGLLLRNPCEQADPPSSTEVKGRALAARCVYSWNELQRFVAVAAADRSYAMWHLFASTGMRRSEMAALRWQHVDLEVGVISVVRVAVEYSGRVHEKELPKSSSSRRAIELDANQSSWTPSTSRYLVSTSACSAKNASKPAKPGTTRTSSSPPALGKTFTHPRSPAPSTTSASEPASQRRASTTCDTRTPRCCSSPARSPRWSPNASGTPPLPTPRTRTSTSCRDAAQRSAPVPGAPQSALHDFAG